MHADWSLWLALAAAAAAVTGLVGWALVWLVALSD